MFQLIGWIIWVIWLFLMVGQHSEQLWMLYLVHHVLETIWILTYLKLADIYIMSLPFSIFIWPDSIHLIAENDSGGNFLVYTRWGRVGAKGGTKISGPYTSAYDATSEFVSKFYEKTKNYWSNRKDFFCEPKHYVWLEMDYAENGKDSSVSCFKFLVLYWDNHVVNLLFLAFCIDVNPIALYHNCVDVLYSLFFPST